MANEFYNRGATFNPDELADGDAIEAEFDAVGRGFDTIEDLVNANKAGYPTQTFHVAPAELDTHAVPKAQMDAALSFKLDTVNYNASDILTKLKTVDGASSGLDADYLDGQHGSYYRDASNINAGTLAKERLPGTIDSATTGTASTASNAAGNIFSTSGAGGENQFRVKCNGYEDAYMFNNSGTWGAYSARGGIAYQFEPWNNRFFFNGHANTAGGVIGEAPQGGGWNAIDAKMAGDDFFRIRCFSGVYDAGYVEIATADNGNEPILVRQYNGKFVSVARTLTLLDGSGNTVIPGNLYLYGGIALVEYGSNGNGEYYRFADGTQICCRRIGAYAQCPAEHAFGAAFIANPVVLICNDSVAAAYSSTVNIAPRKFSFLSSTTNDTVTIIAIGRWK